MNGILYTTVSIQGHPLREVETGGLEIGRACGKDANMVPQVSAGRCAKIGSSIHET